MIKDITMEEVYNKAVTHAAEKYGEDFSLWSIDPIAEARMEVVDFMTYAALAEMQRHYPFPTLDDGEKQ